ncbi:hypothetical protein KSP39_PZI022016 [Platanthera zijinensis]|uniref:Integrase catalytic domain-containing protein n=1 Tax=Platanthera zijinensis TaxID=2320716 RepID=A0AAP0AYE2_9ASPA
MYRDLKKLFWWPGLKKDVALFVAKCQTCALVKAECQKPGGLLKSFNIPEWNGETGELYVDNIVRLHGVPRSIVSDRDGHFTSNDWRLVQQMLETKLKFNTAFHPQTDGQTERVNRTIEYMLHMCSGSKVVQEQEVENTTSLVRIIRERLLISQDRQAKYYNAKHRNVEFVVGDWVYLKIKPFKGVSRVQRLKKLSPRYLGPFEILERVGEAAYRLKLSVELSGLHDVFHISVLQQAVQEPLQVIAMDQVPVDEGLTTKVKPVRIEDFEVKRIRKKEIQMVKVRWDNCGWEELSWEREQTMLEEYLELFRSGTA